MNNLQKQVDADTRRASRKIITTYAGELLFRQASPQLLRLLDPQQRQLFELLLKQLSHHPLLKLVSGLIGEHLVESYLGTQLNGMSTEALHTMAMVIVEGKVRRARRDAAIKLRLGLLISFKDKGLVWAGGKFTLIRAGESSEEVSWRQVLQLIKQGFE